MKRRILWGWLTPVAIVTGAAWAATTYAGQVEPVFDSGNFVAGVDHPFFPLSPGTTFSYRAETADGIETETVTVTKQTRTIMGVTAMVVHDQVSLNGSLTEDTFDWYAQDRQGNVWYLGEDSRQYDHGRLTGTNGSWEAGRDGAMPGVIMLVDPQNGDSYAQEFAPGVGEDMAKVVSLKSVATVPFGTYSDCLETVDYSHLEPGAKDHKFYARGVGLVLEVATGTGQERNELVDMSPK